MMANDQGSRGRHPSGKPHHNEPLKRLPIQRPTFAEPLVSRLRLPPLRDAIGFLHKIVGDNDVGDE
jgi:hypothetical protein